MRTFRDHNDALAAHVSFTRMVTAHIDSISRGWLDDRLDKYGMNAASPSAVSFKHMIEDALNTDTVWITHEMMDLTQRAMETFDMSEEFTVDRDCFIPHGFMVLPEPFFSIDVHGKRIGERAILWRYEPFGAVAISRATARELVHAGKVRWTDANGRPITPKTLDEIGLPDDDDSEHLTYSYDLNQPGEPMPVLRITTISHIGDPDDFEDTFDPVFREHLLARGMEWGIAHTTAIPTRFIHSAKDTGNEGDPTSGWLRFFRVAQRLMCERIITSDRMKAARPFRRDAQRLGYDFGAPRVIQLRRRDERESDPERERVRDVNWTHRWIVGGHWHTYHFKDGPHQVFVGDYEKGPKNLPLVIRERVWNWDR